MPDDAIRLTLPPDADMAAVASIAVRAAARQAVLPDAEIDRLRAAVVEVFTIQAERSDDPIEIVLRPRRGRVVIQVGSVAVA